MNSNLDGVWPVMITPFKEPLDASSIPEVDYPCLDTLIEWYISSGVHGLFSICLSSEMFDLSYEERYEIAKRVCDQVNGRVPVVVGATFEGGVARHIEFINSIRNFATAAVFITNQICEMEESDDVWIRNAQEILDGTGDFPLGVYESPYPLPRFLSPKIGAWMSSTKRFIYYKSNKPNIHEMKAIIESIQELPNSGIGFYSGSSLLFNSILECGGNGYSGIALNYFPWLLLWMLNNRNDSRVKKVHEFLLMTNQIHCNKYPTACKVYLNKMLGLDIKPVSRFKYIPLDEPDVWVLETMHEQMIKLCEELGIEIVKPQKVKR